MKKRKIRFEDDMKNIWRMFFHLFESFSDYEKRVNASLGRSIARAVVSLNLCRKSAKTLDSPNLTSEQRQRELMRHLRWLRISKSQLHPSDPGRIWD